MRALQVKPDLTAQTHTVIRNAIISGELGPCAPLTQEELASRLGVSRQPISHALVLLRQEGLVVDRGRKGQMVAPIDADRLLGLYQVRGALDRLAARLVAVRSHKRDNIGLNLNALVESGKAAAAKGDITLLVRSDVAFHKTLHDLSGNGEIAMTADVLWPHMVRSMRVVLEDEISWTSIWREHAAIAGAVIAGETEQAGALAAQHAEEAGEATYRRLKGH